MYQQYDELSERILNDLMVKGKSKSIISTTRTSIRKFKEFMQKKGLQYTPEIAAQWLEQEIRPNSIHEIYKRIRYVHYKIAILFDAKQNLKELFYKDIQSNYDRLPFWAQKVVFSFLEHYRSKQKCIVLYKAGASTFLLYHINKGLGIISDLSYEHCATYYKQNGWVTGVRQFLIYLDHQGMISPYVQNSYHFKFSKRMIKIPLDSSLRRCSQGYNLQEYQIAQSKLHRKLKTQGYSLSIIKGFRVASNEFGVFLGFNGLCYSADSVAVYIENFQSTISPHVYNLRRSILSIGYLLSHSETDQIPRVFSENQSKSLPAWVEPEYSTYVAIRERSGKCRSTLDMDRSSLTRFLVYLNAEGCQAFDDISVDLIKGFNLQDQHATNAGKNAYNVRIRGFLRFLETRGLISKNISKALPSINTVKVRPAVILSSDDLNTINCYCDTSENMGKYLESSILKIATQTGLRGIDITRLRCDAIDWRNQEFSLIQQKTRKHIRLPFSNGLGNTILMYIEEERPRLESPYLFINPRAPHDRFSRGKISQIVSKALGIRTGTHILRKTFASNLLQSGVGYDTVSDVLGHESSKTVDPYLSTDSLKMRLCAIPLGITFQYRGGLL